MNTRTIQERMDRIMTTVEALEQGEVLSGWTQEQKLIARYASVQCHLDDGNGRYRRRDFEQTWGPVEDSPVDWIPWMDGSDQWHWAGYFLTIKQTKGKRHARYVRSYLGGKSEDVLFEGQILQHTPVSGTVGGFFRGKMSPEDKELHKKLRQEMRIYFSFWACYYL